ncbi:hypothetical protein QYF36_013076 [Acer negundo]|nr:hypothetical protein QYF36_013076 [Acer negundo]
MTRCIDSLLPQLVRQTIVGRISMPPPLYANLPPPHVSQLLQTKRIKSWGSYSGVFKRLIEKVRPRVVMSSSMLAPFLVPRHFTCESGLMKLCEWGVVGNLIEINAGHDFNSAWADINRAWRILRPGEVIFGHDYFAMADNRGVRRAVNLFAKINGLQVQTDDQHWVIDSAANV